LGGDIDSLSVGRLAWGVTKFWKIELSLAMPVSDVQDTFLGGAGDDIGLADVE